MHLFFWLKIQSHYSWIQVSLLYWSKMCFIDSMINRVTLETSEQVCSHRVLVVFCTVSIVGAVWIFLGFRFVGEKGPSHWLFSLVKECTRREMEVMEKQTTKSRGRTHRPVLCELHSEETLNKNMMRGELKSDCSGSTGRGHLFMTWQKKCYSN